MALVVVAFVGLVLGGCGGGGGAAPKARTVDVDMVDVAFRPDRVDVKVGETVTFRFRNTGTLDHSALLADPATQKQHNDDMIRANREDTTQSHSHHLGADVLLVRPGGTGTLTHTFDSAGTWEIACHEPGHYLGGTELTIVVS